MNQAESDNLLNFCNQYGFVYDGKKPNIILVNTCAVTENAEKKSRQKINGLKNKYPKADIWAFGCGVRWQKENFEGKDIIVFPTLNEIKKKIKTEHKKSKNEIKKITTHTRKEILIQSGCENFCSYCAVVLLRGRSKNRTMQAILKEVKACEKNNIPEIVLTGTNIGAYGASKTTLPKESKLAELLIFLLKNTYKIKIRLSSLGPQYISNELIQVLKNKRIASYLHISLQSGSDKVLKLMNRPYSGKNALNKIKRIQKSCPKMAFSADIITGFPGEDEAEYEETYSFIKEVGFTKLHVFPYSERKNTAAASLKEVIPVKIRKERAKKLRELGNKIRQKYLKKQLGKKIEMIAEQYKNGYLMGNSEDYLQIKVKGSKKLVGQIIEVKIEKIEKNYLIGRV